MHAIETQADGREAFYSLREPAWHRLGFVSQEPLPTLEALREAGLLGWDVRVEELPLPDHMYSVDPVLATVRNRPGGLPGETDLLGTVGTRYVPFQNEAMAEFGEALNDEGAMTETAGSLRDGRQVFYTMKIDKSLVLDPSGSNDVTDLYLIVSNSHDGTKAIQALISPVRVVCANTLNFALAHAKASFSIRHTAGARHKVDEAKRALGIVGGYFDEFEVLARELFETQVTNDKFEQIVQAVFPIDDDASKAAVTRRENKIEAVTGLWTADQNLPIHGTAWGAVNALTEWLDYGRNAHSDEADAAKASGFDLVTNKTRNTMLQAVQAIV